MPNSLRTGPANRMAGWKRGAKQKPMPTSSMHRATPFGPRSTTTPRASSTSAAPTADEEARPPCLHTLAPVAATTRAAMVDTLMLRSRSPPVPQVSTTSMPAGRIERNGVGDHGPDEAGHLVHRLALGPQGDGQRGDLRRGGIAREHLAQHHLGLLGGQRPAGQELGQDAGPSAERLEGEFRFTTGVGHGQSHHRSCPRTPRAMSPSCTWEVPSTMVSWRASRYHCSVGWSSM